MTWIFKHIGLVLFVAGFALECYLLGTGAISMGIFTVLAPATLIAGQAIDHWDSLTEIVLQPWKDIRVSLKLRERADFVAAKAEEVKQLDGTIRQMIAKFVEASYLTSETQNLIPPPRHIRNRINERLTELSRMAIASVPERDAWILDMDAAIKRAQTNPRGDDDPPPNAS
jgi:hypothetical protein